MQQSQARHKWVGDICAICGVQRKTIKRAIITDGISKSQYYAEYYDKKNNLLAGRPTCKLKQ